MSITTEEKMYLNYIDGEWVPGSVEKVDISINPASRHEVVGYVQHSGKEDLDRAVISAKKAQVAWRKLSGVTRGEYLYKVANMLEQRLDEIAKTMTRRWEKHFQKQKVKQQEELQFYATMQEKG
ncbi:aldehyde dehydrogenase family protein [Priestia aryabhattai]|uniref:aldehyde dehydrogenase family protein n=1 Tax=Priestia megaterium TaxID=1404 RepID=UPI0039B8BA95